jgi:peptidylprolyl isomerase
MLRRTILTTALAAPIIAPLGAARAQRALDPQNTLLMQLKDGLVTIQLRPDLAPQHVERIKVLTRRGFYNNIVFHRVIEGFMAQGGDPTGTGMGGSDLPNLPAEFSPTSVARFLRGTCGMARSQSPGSANSQFFIMFAPTPSLDGQYTIWGRVTAGMDAVDKIKRGDPPNGVVRGPDRLRSMRVAADIR